MIKDLVILNSQNNLWTNSLIRVQGDCPYILFSSFSKFFYCDGNMFLANGKSFLVNGKLFLLNGKPFINKSHISCGFFKYA